MARSLTQKVIEMATALARRRQELSPDQRAIAAWLRGNAEIMGSLRTHLTARIEARGQSPVPSDPVVALIDKARDYECRAILMELDAIFRSPMPSLHGTGDEESAL